MPVVLLWIVLSLVPVMVTFLVALEFAVYVVVMLGLVSEMALILLTVLEFAVYVVVMLSLVSVMALILLTVLEFAVYVVVM